MLEVICWVSLFGAIYSYFLYPLVLLVMPKKRLQTEPDKPLPFVTLIITAHNEQKRIQSKLENTLAIDYPEELREILVASDGSTDATNTIVESFHDRGIKLVHVQERKGKENAQLAAIQAARGELIVFSDVATQIPPEALRNLVNVFTDPRVGAISSEDRFITEDGKVAGEGAYVKYEMWLRKLESQVHSLVGLSGSFFAARKDVCENWDISVPSDFNTALNCVTKGYIAVSAPDVLGYYPNLKDDSKEYQRKLRTVIRGMAAVVKKPVVLNPFGLGFFALEVFSHKIMRWLVPWFMLALLISSLLVFQHHVFYMLLLAGQIGFYLVAALGYILPSLRNNTLFKLPFFFFQVNFAIADAGLRFLMGKRITMWEPSKR
ncbi:MAG: glycosyltransferase [Gammaproteobacteria bacterium]|nr:glycosyltransferase [Gammaproteobacteria bacterium]